MIGLLLEVRLWSSYSSALEGHKYFASLPADLFTYFVCVFSVFVCLFVCLFVFRSASTPKDIFALYISVNGPKKEFQQTEECQDSKL